jgi:hypothetical protein
MKAMFRQLLAIFLMGVIFITTTGFGLLEHSCLMNGKKSASVLEKHACCPKKNNASDGTDTSVIKPAVCCESQANIANVDLAPVVAKVANFLEKTFFTVLETVVRMFVSAMQTAEAVLNSSDSSPPLAGKDISIRHHSLLI